MSTLYGSSTVQNTIAFAVEFSVRSRAGILRCLVGPSSAKPSGARRHWTSASNKESNICTVLTTSSISCLLDRRPPSSASWSHFLKRRRLQSVMIPTSTSTPLQRGKRHENDSYVERYLPSYFYLPCGCSFAPHLCISIITVLIRV